MIDNLAQKDLEIQRLRAALIKQTSRTRLFQEMALSKADELYRAHARVANIEESEDCVFCNNKKFYPVNTGNQFNQMCRLCALESNYL